MKTIRLRAAVLAALITGSTVILPMSIAQADCRLCCTVTITCGLK